MQRKARNSAQSGMTLLELILSSMALPIARFTVIREREKELRLDLREMRQAIDKYKDLADQQKIRVELGSEGYPPDLETLVKGGRRGACARSRMIRTRQVGAGRTCSTCFRNPRARLWMGRSIRTGRLFLGRR